MIQRLAHRDQESRYLAVFARSWFDTFPTRDFYLLPLHARGGAHKLHLKSTTFPVTRSRLYLPFQRKMPDYVIHSSPAELNVHVTYKANRELRSRAVCIFRLSFFFFFLFSRFPHHRAAHLEIHPTGKGGARAAILSVNNFRWAEGAA